MANMNKKSIGIKKQQKTIAKKGWGNNRRKDYNKTS
jgi:hypothetical protein